MIGAEQPKSKITLKQFEIFVAIVECGNFTEVGRRLYLAQSTVSSHVGAWEEALGAPLFRRESKRTVQLTPEGKRIYQYAKDVVAKCASLENSISSELTRELTLGASTAPSKSLIPRHVAAFSRRRPQCCCVVRSAASEQVQRMVLDGDVQLGFVGSTDNRQSLVYERVAQDRLVMITANTPYFARKQAEGIMGRALLNQPLIFRDQGSGTQQMIDNYLSRHEQTGKKIHARYYISDPAVLQELVALGAGVSILSALSVENEIRAKRLLVFEMEEQPMVRDIYMVWRKKGSMSELAQEFAEQVRRNNA